MRLFTLLLLLALPTHLSAEEPAMTKANAFQFSFQTIDGETLNLSEKKGNVLMVVNTASHCGFTPQLEGMQTLHETYKDKGLVVLGVPSGDFGGQEFDTEAEAKDFAEKKFSTTFQMTSINEVSGDNAHPFYQWASDEVSLLGTPKWNFHKYIIGKNGELVEWFSSATSPTSTDVVAVIEQELAK